MDARGNEYIDCLGGFGIYNVGHSNASVKAAVQKQMDKQSLHSQELLDPLRSYCAALLSKTLPGDGALQYAFFTNSGAESVEHSLKFAMLSTGGRRHYVALLGAFHGKTLGALSATSKSVFRKAFGGGLLTFSHIPVNDLDALRRVFEASRFTGNEIAGLIIEPVMGEGGIHVCSDEYLRLSRALCDEYGARLIFDEVQSGMGRTGKWWACQHACVVPDIVAIGKAFGGGITAAGAVVGTKAVWERYFENPFLFTTTFGGSPVAMAAAIATIHEIETKGLVSAAAQKGEYLMGRLNDLRRRFPTILREVRGRGLMIGLEFPDDEIGYAFSKGVFARKVLLAGTLINSRVLRVEPPLTITQAEMDTVLARFEDVLCEMEAQGLGVPLDQQTQNDVPTGPAPSKLLRHAVAAVAPAAPSGLVSPPLACAPSPLARLRGDSVESGATSSTEPSHGTSSVHSGESRSVANLDDVDDSDLASEDEGEADFHVSIAGGSSKHPPLSIGRLDGAPLAAAAEAFATSRGSETDDIEEDPQALRAKRRGNRSYAAAAALAPTSPLA
jgi:putrescine aminotransferase